MLKPHRPRPKADVLPRYSEAEDRLNISIVESNRHCRLRGGPRKFKDAWIGSLSGMNWRPD